MGIKPRSKQILSGPVDLKNGQRNSRRDARFLREVLPFGAHLEDHFFTCLHSIPPERVHKVQLQMVLVLQLPRVKHHPKCECDWKPSRETRECDVRDAATQEVQQTVPNASRIANDGALRAHDSLPRDGVSPGAGNDGFAIRHRGPRRTRVWLKSDEVISLQARLLICSENYG